MVTTRSHVYAQRRSRSFSDLTHYFADQSEDNAGQKRGKKEKKPKKESKKEKKEKRNKKESLNAVFAEETDTSEAATDSTKYNHQAPINNLNPDTSPRRKLHIAAGEEREKELSEIREMLMHRKEKPKTELSKR